MVETRQVVQIYGQYSTGTISPIMIDSSSYPIMSPSSSVNVTGTVSLGGAAITIGDINDINGTITAFSGIYHTSTIPTSFPSTSTLGASITALPGNTSTVNILHPASVTNNANYVAAQSTVDVWTPAAGKRFNLTDLIISTKNSVTVELFDETTQIFGSFHLAANGGVVSNFKTPYKSSAINQDLKITTTAGTLSISAVGYES